MKFKDYFDEELFLRQTILRKQKGNSDEKYGNFSVAKKCPRDYKYNLFL